MYSPSFAEYVPQAPYAPGAGRVDILSASHLPATAGRAPTYFNIEGKSIARNPLTDLFFSPTNVDALQDAIRYRIYEATNRQTVIGRQSDQELFVVMRSMYYQYGKNQPTELVPQVRELNQHVLEYAVPEVLSNVRQYEKYKHDVSTLPVPLPHAPLATMKGTRQLEYKPFF